MPKTTEYAVEWCDEWGDIVGSEYFPTRKAALAFRDTLDWPGMVQLAKVTNHWDPRDRDNLLDRDYVYE